MAASVIIRAPGAALLATVRPPWSLSSKDQYMHVDFGQYVGVGPGLLITLKGHTTDLLKPIKARGAVKTLIGDAVGPTGVVKLEGGALELELAYAVRCDDDLTVCPGSMLFDDE